MAQEIDGLGIKWTHKGVKGRVYIGKKHFPGVGNLGVRLFRDSLLDGEAPWLFDISRSGHGYRVTVCSTQTYKRVGGARKRARDIIEQFGLHLAHGKGEV